MTRDMHSSSQRMEDMAISMHKIAEKTENDTASMHIITLVALVFLPGTFVAVRYGVPSAGRLTAALTLDQTFLNSGLYQWDQGLEAGMPTWKPEFFSLFAKICFPMMAITLLIWLAAYWWWSSRQRKRAADERRRFLLEKSDA